MCLPNVHLTLIKADTRKWGVYTYMYVYRCLSVLIIVNVACYNYIIFIIIDIVVITLN